MLVESKHQVCKKLKYNWDILIENIFTIAPRINLLGIALFDSCEGKDSANYTRLSELTEETTCDPNTIQQFDSELLQYSSHGARAVNLLQLLAGSVWPAGS